MRLIGGLLLIVLPGVIMAQTDKLITSFVSPWKAMPVEQKTTGERRAIVEGKTTNLSYFEMHSTSINGGLAPHKPHHHEDEELIIVKDGRLKVTIEGVTKEVGPGGIILVLTGEEHGMVNVEASPAIYYVIRYRGLTPMNHKRGAEAGGSIVMDYKDLSTKDTGKGTRRDYFNRSTSAVEYYEMHVTTLHKGENSHTPHTHAAEEIILVLKGDVQMQIGESFHNATKGDVIFLASNDPHALTNLTDGDCEYFAFQWK